MIKRALNIGVRPATLAAVASLVLTLGLAPAAQAQDGIDRIVSVAADAMSTQDVVPGQQVGEAVVVQGDSATTEVTADGGPELTVTGESGVAIPIDLPGEGVDSGVSLSSSGVAVLADGEADVQFVVQGLDDGTRIEAVVTNARGADDLTFDFGPGMVPRLNSDGSIEVFAVSGGVSFGVASVDAPWAVDAEGSALATHFEVAGSAIVQVVDVSSPEEVFPVVADPKVSPSCGIITCTVRFDRATTKWLSGNVDEKTLAGVIGCGVLAFFTGPGAIVCAIIAGVIIYHSSKAATYYKNGQCYGYRYSPPEAALGWSVPVTRGQYNCS